MDRSARSEDQEAVTRALPKGWGQLARNLWATVVSDGGEVVSVGRAGGALIVEYRGVPPERAERVEMLAGFLKNESLTTCEACGQHGLSWGERPGGPRRHTLCLSCGVSVYFDGREAP